MSNFKQPTVVIGLGGSGKRIILALKKMIAEKSENGISDYPYLKFLSIDTDNSVATVTSSIKAIKPSDLTLNREKETFLLRTDFNKFPDLENISPEIAEWFPNSYRRFLSPSEIDEYPYSSYLNRVCSRFLLAWNANELYTKLSELLRNPVDIQTSKDYAVGSNISNFTNVFICGSLSGNTCSGIFIDVAYMVRHIHNMLETTRKFYIYGMFGLSSMFENSSYNFIKSNCYASLVELNHFTKQNNYENPFRKFKPAYKNFHHDYSKIIAPPFDFPLLFDKETDENPISNFIETVAQNIYALSEYEISADWLSKKFAFTAQTKGIYKGDSSEISYQSMTTYSIEYPRKHITQLCALNLTKKYISKLLQDSYSSEPIKKQINDFIYKNKLTINSCKEYFLTSVDQDKNPVNFEFFIKDKIVNFFDNTEISKETFSDRIKELEAALDNEFESFVNCNSFKINKITDSYKTQISTKLKELLLNTSSITFTIKFIDELNKYFQELHYENRKKHEFSETDLNNLLSDNNKLLSKRLFKNNLDDLMESFIQIYATKIDYYVSSWIAQLLEKISTETPGIQNINDNLLTQYKLLSYSLSDLNNKIDSDIEKTKTFEQNSKRNFIFDYDKDVLQNYNKILADTTEDSIYTKISTNLFNNLNIENNKSSSQISGNSIYLDLINITSKFFKDYINQISIEERSKEFEKTLGILDNEKIKKDVPIEIDEITHNKNELEYSYYDVISSTNNSELIYTKTLLAYPLYSLKTAATIKEYYNQLQKKIAKEQEGNLEVEEKVHVFGAVQFADLFEEEENSCTLANQFRETLMFAFGVRRLIIEDDKVSFYTQRDKQMRLDSPSLVLGDSMDQVMNKVMSMKKIDIQMVKQITEEMDFFKGVIKDNPAVRDKAAEIIKTTFNEISNNLPKGLKVEDLDLLNKLSVDLFD